MKRNALNFPTGKDSLSPAYAWLYFILFLASLALLSDGRLSLEPQLWIGLFGLIAPLGVGITQALRNRKSGSSQALTRESCAIPSWLVIFFFALFIFFRFYRLADVPYWPLSDESVFATVAEDLNQKWDGALLRTEGQMEPLLLWLLAFFFKAAAPSVFSLRVFTVFFSILSSLAAYGAARLFLNRSLSFIYAGLFSFSFWEISLSRQCTPNDLIPFFELGAFLGLGLYARAKKDSARWLGVILLSVWAGLGFYTYINWVVCWAFIVLCFFAVGGRKESLKTIVFLALTLGLAAPMAFARTAPQSMSYIHHCFQNFSLPFSVFQYLQGLFWNGKSSYPLGPARGGYLDAVSGALILTGALYTLRNLSWKIIFILGAGLLLTLLPGFLTNNLELQRVTPALPFLMGLAALGLQSLFAGRSKPFQTALLTGVMLSVAALNTYQLFGPFNEFQQGLPGRHWRSSDYFKAHQILENLSRSSGPVYLFNEWNGDNFDKTLDLACFSFNAAQNPSLTPRNPRWIAFLTDRDYEPFLRKKFPHLQVQVLDPALAQNDPNHLLRLFEMPISDMSPETLATWLRADRDCRQTALAILNKNPSIAWSFFETDYALLAAHYSWDPFLASVLWEKAASFPLMDGNFQTASLDFQKALRAGHPAPHLRHNLNLAVYLSKHPS